MELIKGGSQTALIYDELKLTYDDLLTNINTYSKLLDISEGDKVVIFSENRPEYHYSFFSTWKNKGVAVCVDSSSTSDDLAYIISDCSPKILITSSECLDTAKEAAAKSDPGIKILLMEDLDKELRTSEKKPEDFMEPDDEQLAVILYTSGTTGNPKGVMLTYKNIRVNLREIEGMGIAEMGKDTLLAILPFHHILPLVFTVILPLNYRITAIILKEVSSDSIKDALSKHSISIIIGVPRLYELLHKGVMGKIKSNKIAKILFQLASHVNNQSFRKKLFKKVHQAFGGNIKYLVSGGAKLDEQIAKDFTILGFSVLEGYGMTECAPIISVTRPDKIKPGSPGQILDCMEVKIEDDGEILVKGPNVMLGYYNKPEETKEAIDSEGWLHTGDIGSLDKDKFLFITGRKKELIILANGKNIAPTEIEFKIRELSKDIIQEIVVLENKNQLTAVIYPNFKTLMEKGISNIAETVKWEVIDPYNLQVPNYKKIHNIKIVSEELPKTKLGKFKRFKVKELLQEKAAVQKEVKEPDYREYTIIKKYLEEEKGIKILPNSHLELDLGLDSLDLIELGSFLKSTFSLEIKEDILIENSTVEKLAQYLKINASEISDGKTDWGKILNEDIDIEFPRSWKVLRAVKIILWPVFALYFRLNKNGMKNLPNSPTIIVGNHQSFIDGFMVVNSLPNKVLKNTYFLATVKYFNTPFMKTMADNSNVLVIDINKDLSMTLKGVAKVLKNGKNIVIFPEGARTRSGEVEEFKKAFAIIAKELNVPVVTFGIDGPYEAMPAGQSFPKPKKLRIKFFKPIYPENLKIEEIIVNSRNLIIEWLKD